MTAPPGYNDFTYGPGDNVFAFAGNDIVIGTGNNNIYVGYDGYDLLDYSGFGQGLIFLNDNVGGYSSILRQSDGVRIAFYWTQPASSFEEIHGTAFDDTIHSMGDAVSLQGGGGNDTIIAGANAETLDGGAGTDTVSYVDSLVGVTVDLRLGGAQISAGDANGDTLTGIENLTGSALADSLHGNSGDNVLTGLAGADALVGDAGIDTADYSGSLAGVTVDLVLGTGHGGDAEGDTLATIENLTGSAFADHLYGDADANVLAGGAGDDTLHGGAGADVLDGGDGSDFANYQGSAAAVTLDLLAGTVSGGDAQGDVLTSIENLYGSSFDDQLTGDNGRNVIGGELGDDTIIGHGGDDALNGEAGNDALDGGDGNDRLVGGAGIDTIHGGIGNDSIDAGADNDIVFGDAGNDGLYGGAGDDQIDGGDGNDVLEGAAGADALTGGVGIDTASYASSAAGVTVSLATGTGLGGDAQGDTLAGIENLAGSAQNDVLTGDAGANTLSGGAGDDVLAGGLGGDLLRGGAGNDSFIYTGIGDSTVAAAGKDTIADFATGDHIDLSAIDADGNGGNGDTAFSFGTGAFTGQAGELRIATAGAVQVVYADTNGDRIADFAINVLSDHPLAAADFLL
ncbi:Ca2+-binding RTX toxin-like protein [Inquilinus ginsengisoli]|uniref:Ca2+-binding RTX toxin-like protein n=1 Tax=Inquilinus ginsengisoli TaxID=363840 RepID=A0ABU1JKK6_9PROT|nr:calcium-binding protein [Inquilinus ginsengisoli]MDR6289130.1 Ca2+-binding RTX toxin-like protein [Inquilinus ginsengisoli]